MPARVSATDQHPDAQLGAPRQHAATRGLEVAEEYLDHGVSGAKDLRPALDRLLADAGTVSSGQGPGDARHQALVAVRLPGGKWGVRLEIRGEAQAEAGAIAVILLTTSR